MTELDRKNLLILLVIVAIMCLIADMFSRVPTVCEGTPSTDQHFAFPGMPHLPGLRQN
jgi:hypothetical protein